MELTGKHVLVYGSGISGIGACDLLLESGAIPVIYDSNVNRKKEDVTASLKTPQDVQLILGELKKEALTDITLAVMSPGVPVDIPEVRLMKEMGIPIWSEIELAWQMGKGRTIAITGTNGKTTTTALTGKIMADYLPDVYVVGNIGTPYTSCSLAMNEDTVTVAEVSSFQLETIESFHPQVSAILNITEDHLNRHHTMEEYIRVKELITKNQNADDYCILNYEDEVLRAFGETIEHRLHVVWFSSARELAKGAFVRDGKIIWREDGRETVVVETKDLKIVGRHNYENAMAAIAMTYYAGVPLADIAESVKKFQAVEHRIEYVTEKNGVIFYNDSKGTNPDAAIKAVQAMDRPTLLIGGGYDKQSDYTDWIRSFEGNVRYLVLIGETKEKIKETAIACGYTDVLLAENLEEAVSICAQKAEPGDAVLLSPACASWDQFKSYEQRGKLFKEFVYAL